MDGSITLAMKIGGAGVVKKSERCLSPPSPFFIRFSSSFTSNKTFHSLIFSTTCALPRLIPRESALSRACQLKQATKNILQKENLLSYKVAFAT